MSSPTPKSPSVTVTVNGTSLAVSEGKPILQALLENNIEIPHLCYHPDIPTGGSCDLCVVEVQGEQELKRACELQAKEGMEIRTDTPKVQKKVLENLEKIIGKHALECNDCVRFQKCELLKMSREYKIPPKPIEGGPFHTYETGSIFFDPAKCIGCENCTAECPVGFLELSKENRIQPREDEAVDCVNCGQCIVSCPVGAIEGEGEFENIQELQNLFQDEGKVVVVQFAPSIRTSIGEEFGMDAGSITTGKLVSGLREAGFQYVFDTATAADFTTMEESEELLERLSSNERLPAMTSCCPAWVKFLEFNYPQFIPNLCTSRSPQIMMGGIVKEFWSKEQDIDPDSIVVVSVMPCVAKKEEIKREELKVNGRFPVDMVITTREAARLLKTKKIDLAKLEESEVDTFIGSPSGAGVIYGSSGGVFESALRTAAFKAGEEGVLEIQDIRGAQGIKIKEMKVGDRSVKVRIVSGIRNAAKALEELESDPHAFDALEVMACPGGCVGGGGQPIPSDKETVSKRSAALYQIDEGLHVRCAHDNEYVKKVYETYLSDEGVRKKVLHTRYALRKKSPIIKKKRS